MVRSRETPPQAGFSSAPSIGFAAHARKGKEQSYSQPGFAEALRASGAMIDAATTEKPTKVKLKKEKSKPSPSRSKSESESSQPKGRPSRLDKSDPDEPAERTHNRSFNSSKRNGGDPKITLEIGRKITYSKRDNEWKNFDSGFNAANDHLYGLVEAIDPKKYKLTYLSADEMKNPLFKKLKDYNFHRPSDNENQMRKFKGKIVQFIRCEMERDLSDEEANLCETFDTAERAIARRYDPDNEELEQQTSSEASRVATLGPSLWLPVQFEIEPELAEGTSVDKFAVTLRDTKDVLTSGRNRLIDWLGDRNGLGIDISYFSEDWTPRVDIIQTPDGSAIAGNLGIVDIARPVVMPFGSPVASEVKLYN